MLLLRGGLVFDPSTPSSGVDGFVADVLFDDRGIVVEVGPNLDVDASRAEVHDVAGCWVVPGLVDLRAHLREPGQEYKEDLESGLAAAAAGGFTAVCAMPSTNPVNDNRAVTELIRARAASLGGTRVLPFGAITKGLRGEELAEMAELREAGCVGVTDDRRAVGAGLLRRALEYAATFGLVVMQHCEEPSLGGGLCVHEGAVSTRLGLRGMPRQSEEAAVARDVRVAELTGAPLHVAHVSSAGAVDVLREAKARGVRVTADVTPHHLTWTDEALVGYRTNAKVLPPLREASDRDALRAGVADGTLDCIATDHAPHAPLEKDCELDEAAPGMSGLETALPLVLRLVRDGHLPRARALEALGVAPAKVLGREARVLGGADVTVIDPALAWQVEAGALRSKGHNTLLLGEPVQGAARLTIVGGKVAFAR